MRRARPVLLLLALLLLCVPPAAADHEKRKPQGANRVAERYLPSFRLAVEEAIQNGVTKIKGAQKKDTGTWGNPAAAEAMGYTALPLLTLLKAGVPVDDEHVLRALEALSKMEFKRTYSTACYLMAIQAVYQPKLDMWDTDVGAMRAKRVKPKDVYAKLTAEHRETIEKGVAYLTAAQNSIGLWTYYDEMVKKPLKYDLSNTQYGLLGLRAAADCGVKVKPRVWRLALKGLALVQDATGEKVTLINDVEKDGYVFRTKDVAKVRPFRYTHGKRNGPQGEKTVPTQPATGSMTTAGICSVAICMEGLWRSRKFSGTERRKANDAIRDGLAWLQQNFTVRKNPGHKNLRHHFYYLYGLERMGMLTDRRWIGSHDWYKEGADLLLEKQLEPWGGWAGGTVNNAFAILFLKRATARSTATTNG